MKFFNRCSFPIFSTLVFFYTFSGLTPVSSSVVAIFLAILVVVIILSNYPKLPLRSTEAVIFVLIFYGLITVLRLFSALTQAKDLRYAAALLFSFAIALVGGYAALSLDKVGRGGGLRFLIFTNASGATILAMYYLSVYGVGLRATGNDIVNENIDNFGMVAGMGFVLSLSQILLDEREWSFFKKCFFILLAEVFLVGVLLSYAKAAVLLSLLGMVFAVVLRIRRGFKLMGLIVTLLFFVVILLVIQVSSDSDGIIEWTLRFEERLLNIGSQDIRTLTHSHALRVIEQKPIAGIGFSNFPRSFSIEYGEPLRAHDDLVETYAEMGLVVGTLFLCCILWSVSKWVNLLKWDSNFAVFLPTYFYVLVYMLLRPMLSVIWLHCFLLLPFAMSRERIS